VEEILEIQNLGFGFFSFLLPLLVSFFKNENENLSLPQGAQRAMPQLAELPIYRMLSRKK
jgi:hypothetical protein